MTQVLNMILMVEDEPDIQTVARLALETVGAFSVQICGSGREAIDKAPDLQPDHEISQTDHSFRRPFITIHLRETCWLNS